MNRKNSRERGRRKQLLGKRALTHSLELRSIRREMRETLNEILGHGWKRK